MTDTDTVDRVGTPTPVAGGEGDGDDAVIVSASIQVHGQQWSANVYFTEVPDDATLADELVNVLTAVSVMRGTGVWFEVSRRLRGGA